LTKLVKTVDGGNRYTDSLVLDVDKDFTAVRVVDVNNAWATYDSLVYSDGGLIFKGSIVRTSDGGKTWQRQLETSGNQSSVWGLDFLGSTEAWAIGANISPDLSSFDGCFYHTIDGGNTWKLEASLPNKLPIDIHILSKDSFVVVVVEATGETLTSVLKYTV